MISITVTDGTYTATHRVHAGVTNDEALALALQDLAQMRADDAQVQRVEKLARELWEQFNRAMGVSGITWGKVLPSGREFWRGLAKGILK